MKTKINLNNPHAAPINVDLQWKINVTAPKKGLARFFRKYNRVERDLRLSITDISVPSDLVCDANKLFSILYNDRIYSQAEFPVDVELSGMTLPFQLLFHPDAIRDVKRMQDRNPRIYPIAFTVLLADSDGKEIDRYRDCNYLEIEPLGTRPRFTIDINDEEIQYSSSLGCVQIGTFAAWSDHDFHFTPHFITQASVKLFCQGKDLSKHIWFGNPEAEDAAKTVGFTVKQGRRNVVSIPVYMDFTDISNPVKPKEKYSVECGVSYAPVYSPEVKERAVCQGAFTLLKDLQGTELKTYVATEADGLKPYEASAPAPAVRMNFAPGSRLMGQASVILSNIATDTSNPRAGLHICNLMLAERLQGNVRVVNKEGDTLHRFLHTEGSAVDSMKTAEGFFLPNGADAKTKVKIKFNPSEIADLAESDNFDFTVQSTLSFDYWEDKDGTGLRPEQLKSAKIPVAWHIHLDPNPEWLCVDYGSSAIVCRYDRENLNLKQRKDRIYRDLGRTDRKYEKYKEDNRETGTPFLSSDILFHHVSGSSASTLCSQIDSDSMPPYLDLSVCLSPTSSQIMDEVKRQLPCLKILVGNEYLPEKPDYMTFRYRRRDEEGNLETVDAKTAKSRHEDSCLMRISSIFRESYSALFKYFILPETRGKAVNKLVMTYPNTYTPAHLKVLENIARQTFPKLRPGYLKFVGESDAVAAYYIHNWMSFNPGRDIRSNETVLVYDMGAGTLDLTLLRKTADSDGKITVDILGKIGTGKAGNYLDFLISEILKDSATADDLKAMLNDITVSTKIEPNVKVLSERVKLKDLVKNEIKPKLSPGGEFRVMDYDIPAEIVLEHPKFHSFIDQVTKDLIRRLISFTGRRDLKIDTIITSGRSSRLPSIAKGLRRAAASLGFPNARIISFSDGNNLEKTAVVEGAMAKARIFNAPESPVTIRSRRLYAAYGLMYRTFGQWHYAELLNSSQLPLQSDDSRLEDFEGSAVTVTGTAAAESVKLIQTYLSPADTAEAYNRGDMEFITEMEEYDMNDFGRADTLNARLLLDYKNNVSLYVNGLLTIGNPPKGVDLSSEITKRSIWPVTI